MKKRITSLLFSLVIVFGMAIPTLAWVSSNYETESFQSYSIDEIFKYEYELAKDYCPTISEENFGGIYYDNDQLVVNITDFDLLTDSHSLSSQSATYMNAEFKVVKNSLQDLELVKDFLTQYMNKYSINIVDANEITNQVDILLSDYTDTIINEIQVLVEKFFPGTDFLNFVDDSNHKIQSTVAYEQPTEYYSIDPHIVDFPASPGISIKIGNGYYTLGPTTSSSTAFSAGHGFQNSQTVYLDTMPVPINIGTAQSYYGGKNKDWSSITGNSSVSFQNNTSSTPSIVGASITMWGSVSGKTTGKITRTNVSVAAISPYATLTGMCEGDYSCALGDSGAGIFNSNISKHYGVQSSALFDKNNVWAGKSYFTPLFG